MPTPSHVHLITSCLISSLVLFFFPCKSSIQLHGSMYPGFRGSSMIWTDNSGIFLLSNNTNFGFGFQHIADDVTKFLLVVLHRGTTTVTVLWTANRGSPVKDSDEFLFTADKGNVSLQSNGKSVWSPGTGNMPVAEIQLRDSGNLVMLGGDDGTTVLWESFHYPTDTLLSNQIFTKGMRLTTASTNLSYFLDIGSDDDNDDLILYTMFPSPDTPPQPYWSFNKDTRATTAPRHQTKHNIASLASIVGNSWIFYHRNKTLLIDLSSEPNDDDNNNITTSTWIAILGTDGVITFRSLGIGKSTYYSSSVKIPADPCGTLGRCAPYYECSNGNVCKCPSGLLSRNCHTGIGISGSSPSSPCTRGDGMMVFAGDGLSYPPLELVQPSTRAIDFEGCRSSCESNCSCLTLFFNNGTGDCFLFDNVGNFQFDTATSNTAYVKVLRNQDAKRHRRFSINVLVFPILAVGVVLIVLISGVLYWHRYSSRKRKTTTTNKRNPMLVQEDCTDDIAECLSGKPTRYNYRCLREATNNFTVKLGRGGFGSVYHGILPDGSQVAVKKLDGITGQGEKQFRAEVSTIGSVHHFNLVKLRGFCSKGRQRLLVYEYMAKGSLDKWIFKQQGRPEATSVLLDWKTRFNIALGTAKGLAYLHEDCEAKIIHCDIKPQNVLLDESFHAKVSDFGLAKLMSREQSQVVTNVRGTRGYLAPEWIITKYGVSEKSDVYSYGMVLLEIIGGRKNYDEGQPSERADFPAFVFRMMEEGRLREVVDPELECDLRNDDEESVAVAIKVALWCVQEDVGLRPSMSTVVQMLEGICPVPQPPVSRLRQSRLFARSVDSAGKGEWSPAQPAFNSYTGCSEDWLSGPR